MVLSWLVSAARLISMLYRKYPGEFWLSLLVAAGWWLCFHPGFYSADSFAALAEAQSGRITTAFTAQWPLFIRLITFGTRFPALATLADALVLTYTLWLWCQAALPFRVASRTHVLMVATPLVGAMGITLWHDIFMTSGLLLISAVVTSTRWLSGPFGGRDYVHLMGGSILAGFRPNGLPTLLCFLFIVAIVEKHSRVLKRASLAVATCIGVSAAATFATGNTSLISTAYAQEWMRADLSCILSRTPKLIRIADQETLAALGGIARWSSPAGCSWLNPLPLTSAQFEESQRVVPRIWLTMAASNPFAVARIHADRHAYLIPIPRARVLNTPFLHSTIEFHDRGIQWAHPGLAQQLRKYVRAWNAARGVLAFAGLWFVVLGVLQVLRRRGSFELRPTILMSACLTTLLFITAPIPDARYALFVLITGQAALLAVVIQKWRASEA